MSRFQPTKIPFGLKFVPPEPEAVEEDGIEPDEPSALDASLPPPQRVRLTARRTAGIREAVEAMASLPDENESLHCLVTARMDLTDVINRLILHHGTCQDLRIATLGYNKRNLVALLEWYDTGLCQAVTLLTSKFFRSYSGALWEETQKEFAQRKLPCAACYSHAKVITMTFGGIKYTIEGSANLCGNGSGREQFALIRHEALHAFHSAWIAEMVSQNSGAAESLDVTPEKTQE
jgi:hypothetical protein